MIIKEHDVLFFFNLWYTRTRRKIHEKPKKLIEEYKNLRADYESLREDIVKLRGEKQKLEEEIKSSRKQIEYLRSDTKQEKGRIKGLKESYEVALCHATMNRKRIPRNGTTFMDMEKATGYEVKPRKVKVYR